MGPGFHPRLQVGLHPGTVGFGLDALGLLGIKLDSSPDRVNTGLLPVHSDGRAADEYSRLAPTFKARLSKTELRFGELQPNLPVLTFSDIRLLPPTYQGVSLSSGELTGLTLQAGHLTSSHLRNEAGDDKMIAMLGHVPMRQAQSDAFNYLGGDYAFNDNQSSASLWYGQLQDIYEQGFIGLKHSKPLGDWVLSANLGYFTAREDGDALLGNIDNQAFFRCSPPGRAGIASMSAIRGSMATARSLGYSPTSRRWAMKCRRTSSPTPTSVPTVRYDYNFAAMGIPGLTATVRYITGNNVDTGQGYEGKDRERDRILVTRCRAGCSKAWDSRAKCHGTLNYRSDIDENRLILVYTWQLL